MTVPSPIRPHLDADAHAAAPVSDESQRPGAATGHREGAVLIEDIPYGPEVESDAHHCTLVGTLGAMEAEYASIRRGAGLLDSPHRAVLLVTGADRVDFLNRLVTNELKDLEGGDSVATFLTNRKGRIEADLLVAETGERIVIALDIHQAVSIASMLADAVFTEDVEIHSDPALHVVSIHGPLAADVLRLASTGATNELNDAGASTATIAGATVTVMGHDETGEPGLSLIMPAASALDVWKALLATDEALSSGRHRVRPIGWHAYNIARIEAGTPLFNIDFGPTSIPHETGILRQRVSFTKGCYPGQEVVARLENLGRPKQQLVGLRVQGEALPVAGGQVFARAGGTGVEMSDPVGVVTSSTLSPMLGAASIAFAMVRAKHTAAETTLVVNAEGTQAEALVQGLRFLPEAATTGGSA